MKIQNQRTKSKILINIFRSISTGKENNESNKPQNSQNESENEELQELMAEEISFLKNSETFKYQLPVKILDAAENICKKIMKLK